MPREMRNDEIVVAARTVAWPPVMCSLFACAGAATATRHSPVASAPTVVFDTRDICKLLGTDDGTWLRETPLRTARSHAQPTPARPIAGTFCARRIPVRESSPDFRQSSCGEALRVPAPPARNADQRRGLSPGRGQAGAADGVELHRGRCRRSRHRPAQPDGVLALVVARAGDDRISRA